MSEHTKEPWQYTHNNFEISSIYADGKLVAQCPVDEKVTEETEFALVNIKEANARRIVACVNACAGWSTLFLESVVTIGSTLQKKSDETVLALHKAEQQRDQLQEWNERLLEALKKSYQHLKTADALASESFHKELAEIDDYIKKAEATK